MCRGGTRAAASAPRAGAPPGRRLRPPSWPGTHEIAAVAPPALGTPAQPHRACIPPQPAPSPGPEPACTQRALRAFCVLAHDRACMRAQLAAHPCLSWLLHDCACMRAEMEAHHRACTYLYRFTEAGLKLPLPTVASHRSLSSATSCCSAQGPSEGHRAHCALCAQHRRSSAAARADACASLDLCSQAAFSASACRATSSRALECLCAALCTAHWPSDKDMHTLQGAPQLAGGCSGTSVDAVTIPLRRHAQMLHARPALP